MSEVEIETVDACELDEVTGGTTLPWPQRSPRAQLFHWALRQGKAVYDWATGRNGE